MQTIFIIDKLITLKKRLHICRRCSDDHCKCYKLGETTTIDSSTTNQQTAGSSEPSVTPQPTTQGPLKRMSPLYKKDSQVSSTDHYQCYILIFSLFCLTFKNFFMVNAPKYRSFPTFISRYTTNVVLPTGGKSE